MDYSKIARRVAQQELTSVPVKHNLTTPLFENPKYAKKLDKIQTYSKELVGLIVEYLESLISEMAKDGHTVPEEIESLQAKLPSYAETLAKQFISRAIGG